MRLLLLAVALFFFSASSFSQNAQTFSKIEKILNKAKGKKIMNPISGNDEKIGPQVFSESFVSLTKIGQSKYGSTWMYDYTNLNWSAGFDYYLWSVNGSDKVKQLVIKFKKPVTYEMHVKGETDDKRESNDITLYYMAKDHDELKSLFESSTR